MDAMSYDWPNSHFQQACSNGNDVSEQMQALLDRIAELEKANSNLTAVVVDQVHALQRAEARASKAEEIATEAMTDTVTGLPNRLMFNRTMTEVFDRVSANPYDNLHICMIDLDGLKGVNDNFGHEAGDVLLRLFADKIRETFRLASDDFAARLGGDEFVIAFRNTMDAAPILEKMQELQQDANNWVLSLNKGDVPHQVKVQGFSYGLASLKIRTEHGYLPRPVYCSELMHEADQLMYQDKRIRKGLEANTVTLSKPNTPSL